MYPKKKYTVHLSKRGQDCSQYFPEKGRLECLPLPLEGSLPLRYEWFGGSQVVRAPGRPWDGNLHQYRYSWMYVRPACLSTCLVAFTHTAPPPPPPIPFPATCGLGTARGPRLLECWGVGSNPGASSDFMEVSLLLNQASNSLGRREIDHEVEQENNEAWGTSPLLGHLS